MKIDTVRSFAIIPLLLLLLAACNGSTPTGEGAKQVGAATSGQAPVIASFSPAWQAVGSTITIYGLNFDTTAAKNTVNFNGTATAAVVASASATSLAVIVPSGATIGPVSVTTAAGTATSTTSFVVRGGASAPTITGFSQNSGTVGGQITIAGSNFYAEPENNIVTFNGTPAVVKTAATTSLTVVVPDGASGNLTVTTPGGTAISSNVFTITSPEGTSPAVRNFTPLRGTAGVTQVVIRGRNFDAAAGNNIVRFNGTQIPADVVTDASSTTSLVVTVPAGATTGPITVTNSAGTALSSTGFIITPTGGVNPNLMGGAIRGNMNLSGTVLTFAGGGVVKRLTNGTGAEASFTTPKSMVAYGNSLYVADSGNKVIRKIVIAGTDAGKVTTLAGSGVAGSTDAPGLAASFSSLTGITTDGKNLYVADSGNNKIRIISPRSGVALADMTSSDADVSTFAGSGSMVIKDGFGTAATFKGPNGITTDGVNLYVADGSNKIRKIVIATREVSTFAGSGAYSSKDGIGTAATFFRPQGITFVSNLSGSFLFVTDMGTSLVRKIDIATAAVSTFAGSGMAGSADGIGVAASFRNPGDITPNADGTLLYVADAGNNTIRQIDMASAAVTTLAGTGMAGAADSDVALLATFSQPNGIVMAGTDLFVSDSGNNEIRKISGGAVYTFAGNVDGPSPWNGIGTAATFNNPYGITTDGTNLYVADSGASIIRKIVIATGKVTNMAGSGYTGSVDATGVSASFNHPMGITTDGHYLYVADAGNQKIRQIEISSGVVSTLAGSGALGAADATIGTAATFSQPLGITTDGTNLYVADSGNNKIRKVVISTGSVSTLAGSGLAGSTDNSGISASFKNPTGITTDGVFLYVADTGNNKIRKIDIISREVSLLAGSGDSWYNDLYDNNAASGWFGSAANFHSPSGITTDGKYLYVTDSDNNEIQLVEIATKKVTSLAGSGAFGSADGTGTEASFSLPVGITTDGTCLYTTEYLNSLIRKIQ